MDADLESTLRHVFAETHQRYDLPGLILAVAYGQQDPECVALGTDAVGTLLTASSLLPVASITKLATALTILRLVDRGALSLTDPLSRYVPEAMAAQQGATLLHLMTHSSGLPSHYSDNALSVRPLRTWSDVAAACLNTAPLMPPNTQVMYSNLGPGLLALVVERLTGEPFVQVLDALVVQPLGIEAYLGVEPPHAPAVIAPHEPVTDAWYNMPSWRALGEPWAGLITTAEGALELARAFWNRPDDFLQPTTRALATRNHVAHLLGGEFGATELQPDPWGLGPTLYGRASHRPLSVNDASFGHPGYTGCITWVDPIAYVAWAVLGTRVADNGWLNYALPVIGEAVLGSTKRQQ
jgi:CubicO group peptidase (beta-lactamase class C family)